MGEQKHTPGPWHWERCCGQMVLANYKGLVVLQGNEPEPDGSFKEAFQVNGRHLEKGEMVDFYTEHPDVRLIATAPETAAELERVRALNERLAAALRGLVRWEDNFVMLFDEGTQPWFDLMNDAARARDLLAEIQHSNKQL